ncbi:MAG: hypothetical protein CMH81_03625 [Nitrospiraceae bacterium]|nr:hypothetical protein [Nitrospiraceae bacterium]
MTTQYASVLSRCLRLYLAFILVSLLWPSAVLSQNVAGSGLFGLGTSSESGSSRSSKRERIGRSPRSQSEDDEASSNDARSGKTLQRGGKEKGLSLSKDAKEDNAARKAIEDANDLLLQAGDLNPTLVDGKRFRDVKETIREAETAYESENFSLARQKALAAKRTIVSLVPELSPEEAIGMATKETGPSVIEASFASEEVDPDISRQLTQFGYDIFGSPASTFAPVLDVPVGPDYTLGPDDTLRILVWGLVDGEIEVMVDREGKIFLQNIGTIFVWGLTFKEAKAVITKHLSQFYQEFEVDITLGSLRTIKVYVVGDVAQPGGYSLSSLSTVTNALYAAGGPKKSGSMRQVSLIRDEKVQGVVDLYDYLLLGNKRNDFRLQSGDTVFVPPIGPVVGVAGFIKRPAIYELNEPMRILDGLSLAGGVLPIAYLRQIQVERIKNHREKVLLDLDLTEQPSKGKDSTQNVLLQDGDFIKVLPIYSRTYESVMLEGFVKHPGKYELRPKMRLSEFLQVDDIVPETNLKRGEVVRMDKVTLLHEIIPFVPHLLFEGDRSQDFRLQPEDKVILYSEFKEPEKISLGGEFMRPGVYTIEESERLSSVISRAGGFTRQAYPKAGVFLREAIKERQEQQMTRMTSVQAQRMAVQQAALAAGAVATGIAADASAEGIDLAVMGEQMVLEEAALQVTMGRLVINVTDLDSLVGSPADIPLQDGDSYHIPQTPVSVAVLGAVKNPTAVLHAAGHLLPYYIQRAGGYTNDADKGEMYILRADGDAVSGSIKRYLLEPGDAVVIPPRIKAKIQPLPFWSSLLTIVGNAAIGISAMFLLF